MSSSHKLNDNIISDYIKLTLIVLLTHLLSELISERVNSFSCFPEFEFQNCNMIVGLQVRILRVVSHVKQRQIILSGLIKTKKKKNLLKKIILFHFSICSFTLGKNIILLDFFCFFCLTLVLVSWQASCSSLVMKLVFYKPTILKVHPTISGITAHATMQGRLEHSIISFLLQALIQMNVWHKFDLLSTPQSRLRNLRVT